MFRKIAISTAVLLFTLVVVTWFCRSLIAGLIVDELTRVANSSGLSLSVEFNFKKLALQSVKLDGIVQGVPLSLKVDELVILPSWSALVAGRGEASLKGRLYRGTLEARGVVALGSGEVSASALLERLELSEHPLLATLGIDRGQLTLEVPAFSIKEQVASGTFELNIIKARKTFATTLNKGVPMPITIPAFERADLDLKGGLSPTGLILRPVSASCDFGSGEGDLSATFERSKHSLELRGRSIELQGDFDITISEAGTPLLGDWLPLISQGSLKKDSKHFGLKIEGPSSRPQIRMTPR
jgi:hypothetical protein